MTNTAHSDHDEPAARSRPGRRRKLPAARLLRLRVLPVSGLLAAGAVGLVAAGSGTAPPELYARLLEEDRLAEAIVWDGPDGPVAYRAWSPEQHRDLAHALSGEPGPQPMPVGAAAEASADTGSGGASLAAGAAWSVYLGHVAHALRLEARHRLPWSLLSLTPDQLAVLFDGRELLRRNPEDGRYAYGPAGTVADADPRIAYRFLRDRDLLRPSQEETAWAVAGWLRSRVGSPRKPPTPHEVPACLRTVADILHPADGEAPEIADCHELSGLMAALLRSANVPAAVRRTRFALPGVPPSEHSRVDLPTLGRSVTDASVLAMPLLRPSGNVVPTPALFPTLGWVAENVDDPHHLECRGKDCHAPAQQAFYNAVRRSIHLAVSHLPDGLLVLRLGDAGPEAPAPKLEALLAGELAGWEGEGFLAPFFGRAERRAIVRRVDEELTRVGNGEWRRGVETVRQRWAEAYPGGVSDPSPSDLLSPTRRADRDAARADPGSLKDGASTSGPESAAEPCDRVE